jgi:hypothetical protein
VEGAGTEEKREAKFHIEGQTLYLSFPSHSHLHLSLFPDEKRGETARKTTLILSIKGPWTVLLLRSPFQGHMIRTVTAAAGITCMRPGPGSVQHLEFFIHAVTTI